MDEQKNIDVAQELEALKAQKDAMLAFWKPIEGQHLLKVLSEPTSHNAVFNGQQHAMVGLPVDVGGVKLLWTFRRSLGSRKSIWSQLLMIAEKHKGSLTGLSLRIVVLGSNKDKSYTIIAD